MAILISGLLIWLFFTSGKPVSFTAEVKPILNKNCITCHGGVRQKGGFSLLFRDEALAKTKSGKFAIIPGDPDHSEMIRRITLKDPEDRMPYQHDPLSPEEVSILKRWIKQGAHWGEHWAYEPLKETAIPSQTGFFGLVKKNSDWALNPIDNFIEVKMQEAGLKPSVPADKKTLLRRVSLDITGLPAPESLQKKFLGDQRPGAYEELVDSLLASPHFGEKWAAMWLDLARYADTKGYERDSHRDIWRYRDWLIRAFNSDMPYDQFVREQIAGDLLPEPKDDDYIATAFHRNTMTNDEGGTKNEEFRTAAVLDRVNTTWEAFMGTTFGCVQCHSHPYDPFKHDEFYRFMAYFNDTRDEDTYADYPVLRSLNDTLEQELEKVVKWVKQYGQPGEASAVRKFLKTWQPSINSLTADEFDNSSLDDTKWLAMRIHSSARLQKVDLNNKTQLIYRYQQYKPAGSWQIHLDSAKGPVILSAELKDTTRDWTIARLNLAPCSGVHDLYVTYNNKKVKDPEEKILLYDWFYFTTELPGANQDGFQEISKTFWKVCTAETPSTPIMSDNPADMHRDSYVFERGNWLVKGKKVEPGVPASLNSFPEKMPNNRLGLAEWIVSKQNPLTARTLVNRIWEQIFGTGLAETLEDLGSQGIPPLHRELMNWLSYHFMEDQGWHMKKFIRMIVTSATYRQQSLTTPEELKKDPDNRYYARGVRLRLSAEEIRDQALCISGQLSEKMYGPSVFPYQPKGIWLSPWNGAEWIQSKGEDQYRRALYTYWKRSASYPSMMSFDGVTREVCSARRIRTNTPLQALTTLNDSAYIDIARHLAKRMEKTGGQDVAKKISTGFELATGQEISAKSLAALEGLYQKALTGYQQNPRKAVEMAGEKGASPDQASMAVVANAILNLDEVITKE